MSVGIRLTKNHKTKRKIVYLIHRAEELLSQKGMMPIEELMFELGYMSPEYFKRSVLRFLTTLSPCIDVDNDYVIYTCKENNKPKKEVGEDG